jgi:glycosyltransferase involved in cell wall biosynthesis
VGSRQVHKKIYKNPDMKKVTLKVIIPAFNEEHNIKSILTQLLGQIQNPFKLEEILVVSDGSTDKTVSEAEKIKSKIIKIARYGSRKGKSYRINEEFKKSTADIMVVLDADIKLDGEYFLRKLVYPVINGYDLTSSSVHYLKPRNYFEKILSVSIDVINNSLVTKNHNSGVYSCRGVARAFSGRLHNKIRFPSKVGDDAYSYFYCLKHGYKYKYVINAKAFVRLPSNLADHLKQSRRFSKSQNVIEKIFGKDLISGEYSASSKKTYIQTVKLFMKKPIATTLYLLIYFCTRIITDFKAENSDKWNVAESSKILEV